MTSLFLASETAITTAVAVILVVGVGCIWLASRLRAPSILLLLPAGVILGPGLDILDPDEQFGDLLFPIVALGVGILLFEGGLGLRFDRLAGVSNVVGRLVTIGAFIVWVVGAVSAYYLFDVRRALAALIGAVLVVSGPTVVQPLLRLAKPRTSVAEILRWEGIVIDPIGATLSVVVLDALLEQSSLRGFITRIVLTLLFGSIIGVAVGAGLAVALARHWVPDHLQNPVALAAAIGSFALADLVRPEAGLMAATAAGLVLANQRRAPARHILEFEEELGLVVLGGLFLVLGARVDIDQVVDEFPRALILTIILIVVARPLAVAASTVGSSLTTRERAFLAFVAPRGIVAAAVSAVFALEIEDQGLDAGPLVSVVFSVIVLTVLFYGLTAVPAARYLQVARPPQRAVAIVGADRWHLDFAGKLQDAGISVLLFTDRPFERRRAERQALLVFAGQLDDESVEEAAGALGISTVLVLTDRTELATAVVSILGPVVGRANVFSTGDRAGLEGVGVSAALATRHAVGLGPETLAAIDGGATLAVVEAEERQESDVAIASLRGDLRPVASFDGSDGDQFIIVRNDEPVPSAT